MIKRLLATLSLIFLLNIVGATTAIGVTKITFADAIVAKVISDIYGYPIVFLDRDNITNETLEYLESLNVTDILIVGGPYVISEKVENELRNLGYNVTRIWGVTRYETSSIVAKYFWDNSSEAALVTSDLVNEFRKEAEILDNVKGAVDLAVEKKIPILITPSGSLDRNVAEALIDLGVKKVYIFTSAPLGKDLIDSIESLNISYEVNRSYSCKNVVYIDIPKNASWREVIAFIELPSCHRLRFGVNASNYTERIRNIYLKWERKKITRAKTKLNELLRIRIVKMLQDLKDEIGLWDEMGYKNISENLSHYYNRSMKYLENDEYNKALSEVLQGLKIAREQKLKTKIYRKEVKIRKEEIKNIVEKLIRARKEIVKRIMNITKERKENKFCIQVVVWACNDKGECKQFPNPCEVPRGWKISYGPKPSIKSSKK